MNKKITLILSLLILNIAFADSNQSVIQQLANSSIPYSGTGTWTWATAQIEGRFYNPIINYFKQIAPSNPSIDLFSSMGLPFWFGILAVYLLSKALQAKIDIIFYVYTVIVLVWLILGFWLGNTGLANQITGMNNTINFTLPPP